MESNRGIFGAIGVIVAVLAVLFFVSTKLSPASNPGEDAELNLQAYDLNSVIAPDANNGWIGDHVKGSLDAPVTIFEYADYQCSGCANLNSVVSQLLKEYDGKLRVVYRNFPLTSIHPNAIAAASAVEAAALQGYWEAYGDLLFANQAEWYYDSGTARTDRFMSYFTAVAGESADLPKFRQDIASANVKKKVAFDQAIAEEIKLEATPSFFGADGQEIDWISADLNTREDILNFFRNYIDSELAKLAQ